MPGSIRYAILQYISFTNKVKEVEIDAVLSDGLQNKFTAFIFN
jgi:hypothetical protein